jgi:hypothetical protein
MFVVLFLLCLRSRTFFFSFALFKKHTHTATMMQTLLIIAAFACAIAISVLISGYRAQSLLDARIDAHVLSSPVHIVEDILFDIAGVDPMSFGNIYKALRDKKMFRAVDDRAGPLAAAISTEITAFVRGLSKDEVAYLNTRNLADRYKAADRYGRRGQHDMAVKAMMPPESVVASLEPKVMKLGHKLESIAQEHRQQQQQQPAAAAAAAAQAQQAQQTAQQAQQTAQQAQQQARQAQQTAQQAQQAQAQAY